MQVTRRMVDIYLRNSSMGTHKVGKLKGIYQRSIGPTSSFKILGQTWREVYIALLSRATSPAERRLLDRIKQGG